MPAQSAPRQCLSFDRNWRFTRHDDSRFSDPGVDDSTWRHLHLPHDYSIEGHYDRMHKTGREQAFLPTGIGWYRKRFNVRPEWLNRRVAVAFDGIHRNSDVWINGHHLGHRPSGYVSFAYDLSPFLSEKDNVLAVRVDTSNAPTNRWYAGSGIYRHVWLNITAPLAVRRHGTFVWWETDRRDSALGHIECNIRNDWPDDKDIHVRCRLLDPEQNEVLRTQEGVSVPAKDSSIVRFTPVLNSPRLWSPDNPQLYRLITEVRWDDDIKDRYETVTGVRNLDFSADSGLALNGQSIKLRGVCNHHDAGPLGAAVPDSVLRSRLVALKEMGCNAIRTGHTPFAPEFYSMCDKLGLMVIDEIFDGWHQKAEYDYGATSFDDWWRRDVIEWIKRDRNHPCVIMWSIGNETGSHDVHDITGLCHSLDPSRMVTGGQIQTGVDIPGFNGPGAIPDTLEQWHEQHPSRKILLTEVPHTYSTRGFYRTCTWWRDYQNPRFDIPDLTEEELFDEDYATNHPHTVCYNSSYDNATVRISCRQSWQRTRDFDCVLGEFRWTGFDYLGESFGWPFRSGNNGVLDLCGFPKDSYYFYQSQWTDEPMIHLLPHWTWPGREDVTIPVWAYTNCEAAELFLNDESLGVRRPGRTWDAMQCEWHVPYEPGTLKAVGYVNGDVMATCVRETTGTMADIRLNSNTDHLPARTTDLAAVTVSSVDENGRFVVRGSNRIGFHISGPAHLRAVGNGDPHDLEPHTASNRRLFAGRARAYIDAESDDAPICLTACAITGNRFFRDSQKIGVTVRHIPLRGPLRKPVCHITWTTDENIPIDDGDQYNGPRTISEDSTAHALIRLGNQHIKLTETFHRGPGIRFDPDSAPDDVPLSSSLIGLWRDESRPDHQLRFKPNGTVDVLCDGEVTNRASWWYADPVDSFEDAHSDSDNGQIQFVWHKTGLKLVDGRLRTRTGDEVTYWERMEGERRETGSGYGLQDS